MNKLTALVVTLLITNTAFAQKDSLAFGDNGKYIYYKVVSLDKPKADILYQKALLFFTAMGKDKSFRISNRNDKDMSVTGEGLLLVYKPSLTKHPEGQVTYQLKLEVKEGKYRYWLTDFVFTPYFRDRYNSYVPNKNVTVAMEKPSKVLDEKDLIKYLDQAATYSIQVGANLKKAITTGDVVPKKETPAKKVIHINNW